MEDGGDFGALYDDDRLMMGGGGSGHGAPPGMGRIKR